ncbi:HNH endonuclease [Burkholderia sp. Bp8989]|uniref:HNH endonuclease n=1 Tax=Burkholderia sp. Bp8989 TaxID=2184551 RepID=UPI001629F002|nr:HNH endonuclease [Burkholderia sp. Bp8989]
MDKRTADGRRNTCKACTNAAKRKWCSENRDKVKASEAKSYAKYSDKRKLESKVRSERNRVLRLARQKLYIAANRDRLKSKQKEWYEANRDHVIEKASKWRIANLEKAREQSRLKAHRRRLRLATSQGVFDKSDIDALLEKQRWQCVCCRFSLKNGYEIDHIEPISKGGSGHHFNIQLLCRSCNRRKSARDPIEFMQSRGFLL